MFDNYFWFFRSGEWYLSLIIKSQLKSDLSDSVSCWELDANVACVSTLGFSSTGSRLDSCMDTMGLGNLWKPL